MINKENVSFHIETTVKDINPVNLLSSYTKLHKKLPFQSLAIKPKSQMCSAKAFHRRRTIDMHLLCLCNKINFVTYVFLKLESVTITKTLTKIVNWALTQTGSHHIVLRRAEPKFMPVNFGSNKCPSSKVL